MIILENKFAITLGRMAFDLGRKSPKMTKKCNEKKKKEKITHCKKK